MKYCINFVFRHSCMACLTMAFIFNLTILSAQTLCFNAPTTAAGFETCNQNIALTFAPIVIQSISTDSEKSKNGNADRIVRANYDNNWYTSDNWENTPYIANLDVALPNAYYHVIWTDNFWIVYYTFYWARDYGQHNFLGTCNFAHHEGDADKVILIVARPSNPGVDPATLRKGIIVTRHGNEYAMDCDNELYSIADANPYIGGGQTHPRVGTAAGTHAFFHNISDAYPKESGIFKCTPNAESRISYSPGMTAVKNAMPQSGFSFERYTLEDVVIKNGLWDKRYDTGAFPEWAKFGCNNYNCGGPALASAPWNGVRGSDPIALLEDYNVTYTGWPPIVTYSPFYVSCDCRTIICDGGNGNLAFTDNQYVYNPFVCENMPPFTITGGNDIYLPNQEFLLSANSFGATGSNTASWEIPSQFQILPSLPNDPNNSIRLKVKSWVQPGHYGVEATQEIAPCFRKRARSIHIGSQATPTIEADVINCSNDRPTKVIFSIPNNAYPSGTTFQWTSNGNPSSGTGTSFLVHASGSTNYMHVTLVITLPTGVVIVANRHLSDCEGDGNGPWLTGGGGDGDSGLLRVSPNPTNSQVCIYIEDILSETPNTSQFVNFNTLNATPIQLLDSSIDYLEVYLVKDANIVRNIKMDQTLQCIDVSGLGDGLYQVVTQYENLVYSTNIVKGSD